MRFGLDDATLAKIVGVFEDSPEVEAAILYGSRAKGTQRPGSDIDLCLQGERLNLRALNRVAAQLDDLLLPYTFDLCIWHQLDNPEFIDHIKRVGQRIYEREREGMGEWKETKIRDIARFNRCSINKDYHFQMIEYIDTSSVERGKLLEVQNLNLSESPSRAKRIIKKNDILISSVRPNLEHYYFVKECKENIIASTGFVVITPTAKVEPYFLYALLTTKRYTNYLTQIANSHTSTFPSFNPEVIENSVLPIPEIVEQKAIAAILSALDNKIDLLRRQNATLERLAHTLFTRWFVEFEFPSYLSASGFSGFGDFQDYFPISSSCKSLNPANPDADKGYKSRGGAMAASELGEIPAGWRVGKIGDIYKTTSGGTPSRRIEEFYDNGRFLWVKSKELYDSIIIDTEEKISESGLKNSSAKLLPENTILIAMYGATVGQMSILGTKATCNQAICAVLENDNYSFSYVYLWLKLRHREWTNLAIGSAQQNLSQIVISNYKILIPNNRVLNKFSTIVNPMFQKQKNNTQQIQTLTHLRDVLLPKLMNGQIRVRG